MRVLLIHNRYALRGGEDESTDAERELLEARGDTVELYEVSNEDLAGYESIGPREVASAVRLGVRSIWSQSSFRAVGERIVRFGPDIVHVQNTFPLLSPSVLYAAHRAGVPVVQTLRNYRQLCPKASLFRDGAPCEDCVGKRVPWPGVRHACYRDSRATTLWVTASHAVHSVGGTWASKVDLYIAPSEFTRRKFVESGLVPADAIVVKPNFLPTDPGPGDGSGGHFLFVGRLSEEKGIRTLLAAWDLVPPGQHLVILGDGPLNTEVERFASDRDNVTWRGRVEHTEAVAEMGRARALVFPSEWYETFGRVAMEAFARGTPVIGSDIGAVAEITGGSDGGLLFEAGNAAKLAKAIDWAAGEQEAVQRMRVAARHTYEAKYRADRNYQLLREAYQLATERHRAD